MPANPLTDHSMIKIVCLMMPGQDVSSTHFLPCRQIAAFVTSLEVSISISPKCTGDI